jgi:hypothetical protein
VPALKEGKTRKERVASFFLCCVEDNYCLPVYSRSCCQKLTTLSESRLLDKQCTGRDVPWLSTSG